MNLILDERKHAETLLLHKEITRKPMKDVECLIKYYLIEKKLSREQAYELVVEFMYQAHKKFQETAWRTRVNECFDKLMAEDLHFKKFNNIIITKKEWQVILSIEDTVLRKLAYSLLAHAKLQRLIKNKESKFVGVELKEIISDMKKTMTRGVTERINKTDDQHKLIYVLKNMNLIYTARDMRRDTIYVDFIDDENTEVEFIIENPHDYLKYYCERHNEELRECPVCGEIVSIRKKGQQAKKLCPKCKKRKDRDATRLRTQKYRDNLKTRMK